jgi:hypothetical protein
MWFRIVGKGIHSQNHMAKLKPEIERLCQQHNFKYFVEENQGRILVKFGQGSGFMSQDEASSYWNQNQGYSQQGYQTSSQQAYTQPQPAYQGGYQGNQDQEVIEEAVPLLKKLLSCCTVM